MRSLTELFYKVIKKAEKEKIETTEKKVYIPVTTAQDDWDDYHGRKSND